VKALGIGDFPVRMMNEQDEELMSGTTKKSSKKTRKQRKRESAAAAEQAPQGVLAVDRHHGVQKPIGFHVGPLVADKA